MAYCTVNGAPVLEGVVTLPRIGVWQADVELPASGALSGRATVDIGGVLTLVGTFARSGVDGRGRVRARIVAGAAGLGRTLAPKSYFGVPLRIPLTDVLVDAGEQISPMADVQVLAQQLPAWSRMSQVAGLSLVALVNAAAASWRVLLDGTVWVGTEAWPTSLMVAEAVSFEPELFRRTVASLAPIVLPGQVYEGQRIALVRHVLSPIAIRTVLHTE